MALSDILGLELLVGRFSCFDGKGGLGGGFLGGDVWGGSASFIWPIFSGRGRFEEGVETAGANEPRVEGCCNGAVLVSR